MPVTGLRCLIGSEVSRYFASRGLSVTELDNTGRTVIEGCRPFLSPHFNLTVELPLKTIVRGYSWTVMPITWRNRRSGESKLKIKEMGSRYLFVALYCWLEKYFSRGDYRAK
jgi:dolichol-phosphate mannosyltransferase